MSQAPSGGGLAAPGGGLGLILRAAAAVDRGIALLCTSVLLATGTALLIVLGANVLARYALATGGFDWAQEVPERLFTWFIMAGIARAAQHGGHVAVEWLPPQLARGPRRVLLVGVHLLVVVAYAVLAKVALDVAAITAIELSPVLRLPTSHGYYALAGGCVLLAVASLAITLRLAILGPDALPRPVADEPTS